jgi:hypothetical protein
MAAAKPPVEAETVRQIPLINGVDPTPASSPQHNRGGGIDSVVLQPRVIHHERQSSDRDAFRPV